MIFNNLTTFNSINFNGQSIVKCFSNGNILFQNQNITLTNLLNNEGNFITDSNSDGVADGWSQYGMSSTSVSSNVQSFTPTFQYASMKHVVNTTFENIFYYCCYLRSSKTSTRLCLQAAPSLQSRHSGSGNFEFKSLYFTSLNTNSQFTVDDDSSSTWSQIQLKQCFAFNLTACFGAGKEPKQEIMDAYMQDVISQGYFTSKQYN